VVKDVNAADVRRWAREAGLKVGDRGRLSPQLMNDYLVAHGAAQGEAASRLLPGTTTANRPRPVGAGSTRTVRAKTRWDWNRNNT
jgi:hypothetical protein